MEFYIDPDKDHGGGWEARRLTDTGRVLRQWPRTAGVRFAELVDRPKSFGGGQLVLLGFTDHSDSLFPGQICAFDAERSFTIPLWQRRVETAEVLPELRTHRSASGDQFRVVFGRLYDVFPEKEFPQNPGPEIVVAFSLRPEPGLITDRFLDYLSCQPGDPRLDPVWYLRLQPDNTPDIVERLTLGSPRPPDSPGRNVSFDVRLIQPVGEFVIATIDEHGEETLTSRIVSEGYKHNRNLPKDSSNKIDLPNPDAFKLVPMTTADVMPGSAYSCPNTRDDHP